ncbi:hypothetical protein [Fimbriiglobus ruber]|uniref:Uncharacterized protein n=1 Tax=Fimbriiglobus ruber TaxID=1908690 RepID=A0A225DQX9_9BACT|nr:hypothetical protein [Fimbriiglobus ruber]OWK43802.1 hypothetical protein FRUB_03401 [Fimbriiglobus ruber]
MTEPRPDPNPPPESPGPPVATDRRVSRGIAIVLAFLAVGAAIDLGMRWRARTQGTTREEHLTVAQARDKGFPLALPDSAADVAVFHQTNPTPVVMADFAIEEAAFLEWARDTMLTNLEGDGAEGQNLLARAREHNWVPNDRVIGARPALVTPVGGAPRSVSNGYEITLKGRTPDEEITIVYDRPTRRAYYARMTDPRHGY